jgi:uncharacterized protein (TIGR02271 family)
MARNKDTAVGVFLDENQARQAIQMLQSAGFEARVLDENNLKSLGLANEERDLYHSRFNEGNVLVGVDAKNNGEKAVNIMLEAGAENIEMDAGQGHDAAHYNKLNANQRQYGSIDRQTGRGKNVDDIRVQLREEDLSATKQAQQAGEVQLRKTVREEEREIPVNLAHEEVNIRRQRVDQPYTEGEIGDLQDEVIRVPVYEETAQMQKQGRVAEEVIIDKDVVEEQQTMRGTVRREELDVQPQGDVTRTEGSTDIGRSQADTDQYNRP